MRTTSNDSIQRALQSTPKYQFSSRPRAIAPWTWSIAFVLFGVLPLQADLSCYTRYPFAITCIDANTKVVPALLSSVIMNPSSEWKESIKRWSWEGEKDDSPALEYTQGKHIPAVTASRSPARLDRHHPSFHRPSAAQHWNTCKNLMIRSQLASHPGRSRTSRSASHGQR